MFWQIIINRTTGSNKWQKNLELADLLRPYISSKRSFPKDPSPNYQQLDPAKKLPVGCII